MSLLQRIKDLTKQLAESEASIAQHSMADHWQEAMTFLIQMSGVGLYTGMIILAAIGDIERFPSATKLVGYSGLGARVHASGDARYTGKIGRKELRTALIASVWVAVR